MWWYNELLNNDLLNFESKIQQLIQYLMVSQNDDKNLFFSEPAGTFVMSY